METIGKRIMINRKKLGLTQEQLAEKLGITAQAVSKWENDQSCPDISVLTQLADIFDTTVDSLLGRQNPAVRTAQIITESDSDNAKKDPGFEMEWNSGKKDAVGIGVFVLFSGVLYFLSELLNWDITFWNILWPSALLFFGAWGLYPRFSFFRISCLALGIFFLVKNIFSLSLTLDNGIITALVVIVVGCALIIDGIKKSNKPKLNISYTDKFGKKHYGEYSNNFEYGDDYFSYSTSFGNAIQTIDLEQLKWGEISTNFGEYTVDLSDIKSVSDSCNIDISCSFGELTVLVPKRIHVKIDSSASFGDVTINGQPDPNTIGTIFVSASASFAEIEIKYV